jgi:hypothetical protein
MALMSAVSSTAIAADDEAAYPAWKFALACRAQLDGACWTFIEGTLDMYAIMADPRMGGGRSLICTPPGGVANDRAREIFLGWMASHPEYDNENRMGAAMALFLAMEKAFPCQ